MAALLGSLWRVYSRYFATNFEATAEEGYHVNSIDYLEIDLRNYFHDIHNYLNTAFLFATILFEQCFRWVWQGTLLITLGAIYLWKKH